MCVLLYILRIRILGVPTPTFFKFKQLKTSKSALAIDNLNNYVKNFISLVEYIDKSKFPYLPLP